MADENSTEENKTNANTEENTENKEGTESGQQTEEQPKTDEGASGESGTEESKRVADLEDPTKEVPAWAPGWAKKRIGKLTAVNAEKERENAQLRARLAEVGTTESKTATDTTEEPKNRSGKTTEQLIEEAADRKLAAQQFNERADAVYDKGKTEFNDWERSVENLKAVGVVGPEADPAFLRTVTKLGEAHKVIHYLAHNPEVASGLIGLPIEDLAMELKEIELKVKQPAKKDVSGLPNPIKPVSPKANPAFSFEDPDSDIAEWIAKRDKVARKKW